MSPLAVIITVAAYYAAMLAIGLVSCAYSAGGSALTAQTTSFTVDILGAGMAGEERLASTRKKVHLGMALLIKRKKDE